VSRVDEQLAEFYAERERRKRERAREKLARASERAYFAYVGHLEDCVGECSWDGETDMNCEEGALRKKEWLRLTPNADTKTRCLRPPELVW